MRVHTQVISSRWRLPSLGSGMTTLRPKSSTKRTQIPDMKSLDVAANDGRTCRQSLMLKAATNKLFGSSEVHQETSLQLMTDLIMHDKTRLKLWDDCADLGRALTSVGQALDCD